MTTPVRPLPVAAGPAPAVPEPTDGVTPRPRRRGDRTAGLLIVPGLVWYGLFMAVPLVVMFALSLFSWNSIVGTPSYTGFSNYRLFANDDLVAIAARNSLIYVVGGLILIVPPGFLLGCWLHRKPRGHAALSIVFFTPWIVSASARAMMFTGLYQPNGVINSVLSGIGLGSLERLWLANSTTALPAAILTEAWTGIGVSGVIFASALSRIPDEVFEAARLDGANRRQEITRFALPLTRDFVALWTMLQFLWLFLGSAANILLLTKGGPGSATLTLSYYMYDQAFVSGRIGYSQAIGVLLFFVGVAGMLLIKVTLGRTEKPS